MDLVHMDDEVLVLAEPAEGVSTFKVGETVSWLEDTRRIDGTVVNIVEDLPNQRRLITVAIERVTPYTPPATPLP